MIVGIIGSRKRNSEDDRSVLHLFLDRIGDENITKIVTGDCEIGGDKFAKDYAREYSIELDIKYKKDLKTGNRWINAEISGWVNYWNFTKMCYARNEEIAKEDMDFLIALVHHSRKGGTENTIKHFRRLHKDWKDKLIIL